MVSRKLNIKCLVFLKICCRFVLKSSSGIVVRMKYVEMKLYVGVCCGMRFVFERVVGMLMIRKVVEIFFV